MEGMVSMERVEKNLIEMKNISELMLDLAYSSVLFHNREIAEEVIELEEKIDDLYEDTLTQILQTCREKDNNLDRAKIPLKVADSIERIADAALDIADVVLRDIDLHPVIKRSIEESDETMVRKEIRKNSFLDGKTLGQSKMATETGMKVIAIRRGSRWSYGPGKNIKLKAGDRIFARGPKDSEEVLNRWLGLKKDAE